MKKITKIFLFSLLLIMVWNMNASSDPIGYSGGFQWTDDGLKVLWITTQGDLAFVLVGDKNGNPLADPNGAASGNPNDGYVRPLYFSIADNAGKAMLANILLIKSQALPFHIRWIGGSTLQAITSHPKNVYTNEKLLSISIL